MKPNTRPTKVAPKPCNRHFRLSSTILTASWIMNYLHVMWATSIPKHGDKRMLIHIHNSNVFRRHFASLLFSEFLLLVNLNIRTHFGGHSSSNHNNILSMEISAKPTRKKFTRVASYFESNEATNSAGPISMCHRIEFSVLRCFSHILFFRPLRMLMLYYENVFVFRILSKHFSAEVRAEAEVETSSDWMIDS